MKTTLFTLIFLCWSIHLAAEEKPSPIPYDNNFIHSQEFLFEGAIITATTVGLYSIDKDTYKFIQKNRSETTYDALRPITWFGKGEVVVGLSALGYLGGHIGGANKLMRTSVMAFKSFLFSGILINLIKISVHRHRPFLGNGPNKFDGPSLKFQSSRLSFASGDSSSAWSLFTVIAYQYPQGIVPYLSYALAATVAYARVYDQKHWVSDAFFGSAVGYYCALKVIASERDNQNPSSAWLLPLIEKDRQGLVWVKNF